MWLGGGGRPDLTDETCINRNIRLLRLFGKMVKIGAIRLIRTWQLPDKIRWCQPGNFFEHRVEC